MKKFYSKYKTDIIITILLITISLALFISIENKNIDDLLLNLSSGVIGSIITIWSIEVLRRKNNDNKIATAKVIAREEILRLRNQLTCFVSNAFDITVYNYIDNEDFSEENTVKVIKKIAEDLSSVDMLSLLEGLSIRQWSHLQENLYIIRKTLSEMLNLYKGILPDEILGQLLLVNKNFDYIYSSFGVFPELFVREEKDWPVNKKGADKNRSIRNSWIKLYAVNFKKYYESIVKLNELLEAVEF